MRCPTCPDSTLVMADRSGVEIDYCPVCRGVWLDRGELDKIIERAAPQAPAPAQHRYSAPPPITTAATTAATPTPTRRRRRRTRCRSSSTSEHPRCGADRPAPSRSARPLPRARTTTCARRCVGPRRTIRAWAVPESGAQAARIVHRDASRIESSLVAGTAASPKSASARALRWPVPPLSSGTASTRSRGSGPASAALAGGGFEDDHGRVGHA